jgi:nitrile hydratase beta subunit
MNGVHDMGGMDGFGKVEPECDEPVFHAEWEARVLALNRAMAATGAFNIDAARYAREMLPPHVYLASSYYWKWFLGLEAMLLERAMIDAEELARGHALHPAQPPRSGKLAPGDVGRVLRRGSFARQPSAPPRFEAGQRVRARNLHPKTHTRLPRYARGHIGTIERLQGCHVFPDATVLGRGEEPQWLYTLVFAAQELWGADADPSHAVSIEAFEPYLEPL